MEKSQVSVFGSSHCKSHHFPENFNWHFWNSEKFFYPPANFSVGGKRITDGSVDFIIRKARQIAPMKHYIVLNLGSNNIRNDHQYPEDLLPRFVEIAEELALIPNVRLVLVSLVPSFARNEEFQNDFWRLGQHFRAMASLYPHVSWVNWVHQLFVNGQLHPGYFEDDVHLSDMGAVIFTNAIFNHISYLP